MSKKDFYVDLDLSGNKINNSIVGENTFLYTTTGALSYGTNGLQINDNDVISNVIHSGNIGNYATTATASNGLTKIGDDIQLGGTLTSDINIDTGVFDYNVSKGNTSIKLATVENFTPGTGVDFNGVYAIGELSNGDLIFGGDFTTYQGETANYIVKTDRFGNRDANFGTNGTGFDSDVLKIVIDDNDKIYVGGYFSSFDGNSIGGFYALNSDGTSYTSFNTNVGTCPDFKGFTFHSHSV